MVRVRYHLAVSLDGFISPPDGGHEWLDPYGPAAVEFMEEFLPAIGGFLMGRLTYEKMRSFGESPFDDEPMVILTSRPQLDDLLPRARPCSDGPRAALEVLRPEVGDKDIWLFGGGVTAASFLREDLVDTIELTTVPVVLGQGLPLFSEAIDPRTFERVSTRPGEVGTVTTVYARR